MMLKSQRDQNRHSIFHQNSIFEKLFHFSSKFKVPAIELELTKLDQRVALLVRKSLDALLKAGHVDWLFGFEEGMSMAVQWETSSPGTFEGGQAFVAREKRLVDQLVRWLP